MAENDAPEMPEIESMNEEVLDADALSAEDLEQVSGGAGCVDFDGGCTGFSGGCTRFSV